MFNFVKFLKAMRKAGWQQIAACHCYERPLHEGELEVRPVSMPGWAFVFIKRMKQLPA